MIPYEELEKALARWKARRAGADSQDVGTGDGVPSAMSPTAVVYQRRETGEVDLVDVVDEN